MNSENDLQRFLEAQNRDYTTALAEIRRGRKQSHWMWYIFPQLAGLGFSSTAQYYAIRDRQQAEDYLAHPILGNRLIEICTALLSIEGRTATQIMGTPDDLKLRSCVTLFGTIEPTNPVFGAVLDKFYNGQPDSKTMHLLAGSK